MTGTAVGASSEVIALSVAAGLIKAVIVMVGTPIIAPLIGLNNPKSAMAYGGLMETTSGVAGGLAASDKRALRSSGGEVAVEASADEQHSESVVVSVAEASGDAAGEFDESIYRLGATVVGAACGEVGQEGLSPAA